MTAPLTTTRVRRRDLQQAVNFDGTRTHADAIIKWVHDAHLGEVGRGHFNGVLYLPLRSGCVIQARAGWWIVQTSETDFKAYAPWTFDSVFEVAA